MSQPLEIVEKLKLVEEEYIELEKIKIYCGTFNVNGRACDESLSAWLCLNNEHLSDSSVDIYAIGFQELVDLTTTNLLLNSSSIEREQAWINGINNELLNADNFKPPTKYILVDKQKMFGLFMLVYVREHLYLNNSIRDFYKSSVATGLMDMVGNKGSVALSMMVHETRICFVCSHFASDTEKLQKRNSDYRASKSRLRFQDLDTASSDLNQTGFDLDDHDFVFWFGDFNYRLDNMSLTDVIKHIYANNYDYLIKFDQLSSERDSRRVFESYQEGKINFKPTYKYLAKTDVYEKQSLVESADPSISIGKQKLPSWTDRIMWRCGGSLKCNQIQYSSINTITISDHKPVYGLFEIEIKKINRQKYDKLYETMLKDADRKYNDELPHIKVDKFDINFGSELLFYDAKQQQMTVTNSGLTRSNVTIMFYDPHQMTDNLKPSQSCWLSIHPQTRDRLEAGASYTAELSTRFNPAVLKRLNRAKKIEDFLIVKCLNGNDVFVTISCGYKSTVIGYSLKCLSQLNGSFDAADQEMLVGVVESEIDKFETDLDEIFRSRLRQNSALIQKEKLQGVDSAPPTSILGSKLEVYNRTFKDLKEVIVDKDPYFGNELSSEYKFLLEHLIERCAANDREEKSADVNDQQTIEEQKNQVLVALSAGRFDDLSRLNLDPELLIEILYDLLYALPHPLIPRRLSDICSYLSELDYEQARSLLAFIPRSHARLFELISKFLGVYIKCFLGESSLVDSGLSRSLAEACFQLDKSEKSKRTLERSPSMRSIASADCKSQNAVKFLNLFVSNYGF